MSSGIKKLKYGAPLGMFFSGNKKDRRGNLYIKLALNSPDFNQSVSDGNVGKEVSQREHDLLKLLKAKEYSKTTKSQGLSLNDNDFFYEVSDMIIQAALWHKKIDKSTEEGLGLSDINNVLRAYQLVYTKVINNPATDFNIKIGSGTGDVRMNPGDNFDPYYVSFQPIIMSARGAIPAPTCIMAGTETESAGMVQDIYRKQSYLNIAHQFMLHIIHSARKLIITPAAYSKLFAGEALDVKGDANIDMVNDWFNTSIDNIIDLLYDNKFASWPLVNRLGASVQERAGPRVTKEMLNTPYATPRNKVESILKSNGISGVSTKLNNLRNLIKDALEEVVTSILDQWFRIYKTKQAEFPVLNPGGSPAGLNDNEVKAVLESSTATFESLVEVVRVTINKYVKNELQSKASHTTFYTDKASSVQLHQSLRNWNSFSDAAQKFLEANISLMQRKNNDWVSVPLSTNVPASEVSDFRFNLKKSSGNTIFGNTLPLLRPEYGLGDLWYTKYDGIPTKISSNGYKPDTLRLLYSEIYKKNPSSQDIANKFMVVSIDNGSGLSYKFEVPVEWSEPSEYMFNLRLGHLFSVMMNETMTAVSSKISGISGNDGYIYDRQRNKYKRDSSGKLYKYGLDGSKLELADRYDEKGNLNPALDSAFDPYNGTCGSTFVTKDGDFCRDYIANCLIANDSTLESCVKKLKEAPNFTQDLREVAEHIHPQMAKATLRKLAFKQFPRHSDVAGKVINVCQSVNEWLADVRSEQNSATFENIMENEPLRRYLDVVVKFVNANPAILNKDYNGASLDLRKTLPPLPEFARKVGVKVFYEPDSGNEIKKYAELKNVIDQYSPVRPLGLPFRTGINFASVSNVSGYFPYAVNSFGPSAPVMKYQLGGNLSWKAQQHHGTRSYNGSNGPELVRKLYSHLSNELKNRGKVLSDKSKTKIETIIDNYETNQRELQDNLHRLERYIQLVDTFGDSYPNQKEIDFDTEVNNLVESHGSLEKRFKSQQMKIYNVLGKLINTASEFAQVSGVPLQSLGVNAPLASQGSYIED